MAAVEHAFEHGQVKRKCLTVRSTVVGGYAEAVLHTFGVDAVEPDRAAEDYQLFVGIFDQMIGHDIVAFERMARGVFVKQYAGCQINACDDCDDTYDPDD